MVVTDQQFKPLCDNVHGDDCSWNNSIDDAPLCFDVDVDVLFAQFVKSRFERASEFAVVLQEVVADGFSDVRAGEDVVENACWK